MEFIHLQVRSGYTILGSSIHLPELMELARVHRLTTLSLIEDGTMHSAIKFYQGCCAAGIKPLIGMSFKVKYDSFIDEWTAIAKDFEGYQFLLKFASIIGVGEGYVDIETVIQASEHLIVCTSGEEGVLVTAIEEQQEELVKSYYEQYLSQLPYLYFGLSRTSVRTSQLSQQLIRLADKFQVPVVALHDVRYLTQADEKIFQILKGIKDNTIYTNLENTGVDRSLMSAEHMQHLYQDCPQALNSVLDIADSCHLEIELNQSLLPKYPTVEGASSSEYLTALCYKGLRKRYGANLTSVHQERLTYELDVINQMGFSDYFLIVWDFIKYAKVNQIAVGPGRGSAAGSLVAYVLGITNVDPIKYELLFERFLNPERVSLPDIDIDFQDTRRDEVIQYVQGKYGAKNVVQIVTFGTFRSRSAWRDVARVYEVDMKLVNRVSSFIHSGSSLEAIYRASEGLQEFFLVYPHLEKIYKEAMRIENLPRHTSIHAAGVIISDHDLTSHTAVMEGSMGIYISQYEADDLEAIGLLKMDFLGLKNLTMLQQIIKFIKDENPSARLQFLSDEQMSDSRTFELIAKGQTTGIFQLESAGMRQVLKKVQPTNLEDIIACNALFRPGPMESIPLFAARKHGKQPVDYYHPHLVNVLKKTYGIIVYQEQIMQIAHLIAGYTLGEADVLRRAVSKKKKDVLEQEEKHFTEQAVTNGYTVELAKELYALILKFANYGFNRSHAVAYSVIAYQMAYLKAHYPRYFMSVALSNVIGSERHTAEYVKEARQLGIEILPPSVNKSQSMYVVEGDNIRFSLLPTKNLGHHLLEQLILERQNGAYQSFYDFVVRTKGFLNQRIYESLIDVGALDEFGYNRATLHENVGAILEFSKYDGGLFETEFEMSSILKELPQSEIMKREKDLLGFYLKAHPISLMHEKIKENGWQVPSDLLVTNSNRVTCIGFVEKVKQIRDKNGNFMGFMDISDENSSISVTLFTKVYKPEYRALTGKVIVVQGTLNERNNEKNLNLIKIIAVT